MKLKRLLSASLMLASLAAAAAAQRTATETREGDVFRGPVKSVRVVRVMYGRSGGALLEGPRRLVAASTYAPDGKRREQESYARDGAVMSRRVFVYDDAGNEIEHTLYDGKDKLQARIVRRPAEGERLTYNGDGSLRERRVVTRSPDGGFVELKIYDGDGVLLERTETRKEGGVPHVKTYAPDGTLKRSRELGPSVSGRSQSVEQSYNPDGTVYGRRVSEFVSNDRALDISADNDGYDPGPKKRRETREFDARRNLSKVTGYVWNEEANDYEVSSVTYYIITYYR